MDPERRIVFIVAAAAIPSLLILGMLFYQLKTVEVATRNAEAELVLGKADRFRREQAALSVDQEPPFEAAAAAGGEPQ